MMITQTNAYRSRYFKYLRFLKFAIERRLNRRSEHVDRKGAYFLLKSIINEFEISEKIVFDENSKYIAGFDEKKREFVFAPERILDSLYKDNPIVNDGKIQKSVLVLLLRFMIAHEVRHSKQDLKWLEPIAEIEKNSPNWYRAIHDTLGPEVDANIAGILYAFRKEYEQRKRK